MLIHVGSGHGSEIPAGDGIAWMALRLKRAIGLDPLSIDQVWGTPRSSAEFDGPLYRGAMSSYRGTEPIVLTDHDGHRSEEHTSELQSLMRISYAVFCLKKKQQ